MVDHNGAVICTVFSSFAALKVFAFDSHHMKHIHPHVYTGGDYIKISPKKREESHPNGKKKQRG